MFSWFKVPTPEQLREKALLETRREIHQYALQAEALNAHLQMLREREKRLVSEVKPVIAHSDLRDLQAVLDPT